MHNSTTTDAHAGSCVSSDSSDIRCDDAVAGVLGYELAGTLNASPAQNSATTHEASKGLDMPNVNIKFLRTFLVLVKERSTAETARRMGMSKANVLTHVDAIEKIVGKRLLERRFPPNLAERGRTQLTQAGRVFLPNAVEAVQAHDMMFVDAAVEQNSREVNQAIAAGLMELALGALRHDLPDDDQKRIHDILSS